MSDVLNYFGILLFFLVLIALFYKPKFYLANDSIRQPNFYHLWGIITLISGIVLSVFIPLVRSGTNQLLTKALIALGSLLIVIFGLLILTFHSNWEIKFTEGELILFGIFRKPRVFSLSDLTIDRHHGKTVIYYKNKVLLSFSYIMQNYKIVSNFIKPVKYNKNSTGTIVGNKNTRNFGITFILLGIVIISLSVVVFLNFIDNTNDIVFAIILSIAGIVSFLSGLFFLLHRYVWKIIITENNLIVKSVFGVSRKYIKKDLFYKKTFNGFRVFNTKTNKHFYFNENFTEHSKLIYSLNSQNNFTSK